MALETPKDAYIFCKQNGLLDVAAAIVGGMNFKQHFEVAYNSLAQGEIAEYVFGASWKGMYDFTHNSGVACVLTNERLIMAQKYAFNKTSRAVQLVTINSVNVHQGAMWSGVDVITNAETIELRTAKKHADVIRAEIQNSMNNVLRTRAQPVVQANTSAADELLKFKQLLDAGVITQQEFDAQKAKLL